VIDFTGHLDEEIVLDSGNFYTDYKARIVPVGNIVSGGLTGVISSLLRLDSVSTDPIILFIRSGGGELQEALLLREVITMDTCYSAGLLVFIAGEIRSCFEFTKFLVHNITIKEADLRNNLETRELIKKLGEEDKYLLNMIQKASKRSKTWWTDKIKNSKQNEFYFNALEARKHGIVNGGTYGRNN